MTEKQERQVARIRLENLFYKVTEVRSGDRWLVSVIRNNTISGFPTRIEVETPSRLIAWQIVLAGAMEIES